MHVIVCMCVQLVGVQFVWSAVSWVCSYIIGLQLVGCAVGLQLVGCAVGGCVVGWVCSWLGVQLVGVCSWLGCAVG